MKKKIISIIIAILVLTVVILVGFYIGNSSFRIWTNKYILKKDIGEEELPTINIEEKDNISAFAYGNYVATVGNNTLTIYNQQAKVVSTINVSITTPKFKSNGKYLLVADDEKSNIYLIYNDSLQWEKTLDGNISQITVNENGAVGVVLTGTTYKSVIVMYDITGEENFRTYLSINSVADLAISNNSKYLSFIEINTTGTVIDSKVKTISIDKAKNKPNEAIIYTYTTSSNSLLLKIKYDNEKVIAFTDSGIHTYSDGNDEEILKIESNTSFVDINLNGYISSIRENSSNIINSEYELQIQNTGNKKINTYLINNTVKNMYSNGNVIAISMGNEVEFVNTSGWLIKKFTSIQNIKDITIGEHAVGIIYKNRIEVLSL